MNSSSQMNFFEDFNISTKRVFRYPGGKSIASRYFSKCLPSDVREVISPFFGGGAFELFLTGRGIRIHGSDLFEPLVNLWNHILVDNKKLAQRAESILHSSNKEKLKEFQKLDRFESLDQLDQAAYLWLFYCLSWNGLAFSGIRNYDLKGREAYLRGYENDQITFFERLENFRNPLISVDLLDYRDQLDRFPNIFAYLDPPYPDVGNLYGNSSKFQDDFDHEELRDILKKRDSLWILSYNNKPIVRELYSDSKFIIKDQWWRQGTNTNQSVKEVVIFPKTMSEYIY